MKGSRWLFLPVALALSACDPAPVENPDNPFSLIKIDAAGQQINAAGQHQSWACALDQRTGLLWEVKSAIPGLRYFANTYSWYDPSSKHQELDYRGLADGGKCSDSRCDTSGYVQAVNQTGLCGYRDWRMPNKFELGSISDPRRPVRAPTTDLKFFPHMQPKEYWSGNDYSMLYNAAWAWGFDFAQDRVDWKRNAKFVRLVRGEVKGVKQID